MDELENKREANALDVFQILSGVKRVGGTLEHIYNVANAMNNMNICLKTGVHLPFSSLRRMGKSWIL